MFYKSLSLIILLFSFLHGTDTYYWKEDYQKTISTAKESKKALIIAFLGTDWCPWSEKLESDVLMKEKFLEGLRDEAIFVRLDFPEYGKGEVNKELARLKEKFKIAEFPTLLLLDEEENEIIKLGYMPMQPEEFSLYIKKMLADWSFVKKATAAGCDLLKEDALESLYLKAKSSGFNGFKEEILEKGLALARGPFFVMEKYATLIECGKKMSKPEMQTLRKEILKRDPHNKKGTQLKLAVLDFQVLANKKNQKYDPKVIIEPLKEYVKKFGAKDKENLWHVEMMMAQYLYSKKMVENALSHAKASYEAAPSDAKSEILETINYLVEQK